MSLSLKRRNGTLASITVKPMGVGSTKLYEASEGEVLGVRGPYGRSFELPRSRNNRVLLVGGGTGMAPIINLAEKLGLFKLASKQIVIGAKTKEELPFIGAG